MKSKAMEGLLDSIGKEMFGRSRIESVQNSICVTCGGGAKEFKDEISKREYRISGMCQECQDSVFKEG